MIYINKTMTASNGATVSHHMVEEISVSPDGQHVVLKAAAWVSSLERAGGQPPIDRWAARIPLQELAGSSGLLAELSAKLIDTGFLSGGAVVPPDEMSLEDRRATKWALLKAQRAEAINAPLETPYGVFGCAGEGRREISDSVLLANNLVAASLPVAITFTLLDNTTVVLGATEMITVGFMLGARVQAAHAHARALRVLKDAAQTVEELDAITWGMTIPE